MTSVKKSFPLLAIVLVAFIATSTAKSEDSIEGDIVVLRALDKVTARTLDLYVPIDEMAEFGSLSIHPRKCLKRPPEEPPETSTFLVITEVNEGVDPIRLFSGWMFASSPAINALEHPVYDVWVIDCRISEPDASAGKE
ncbi:DUF2155 domain-containing protein [Sneathiella marina]|uniref:DUF2155 domain-containing protein n=1 Tax=Sneathiella marina TaxID=2950108 RepID=A0ABY4VX21_9PROT|nr:DUF2155 domain-containing protein [Sneathiella marina]USG59481.1 DUF2155 domain-containing protein [Sneathiella marina]